MIEKKIMGYADFADPKYEPTAVTVMIDSETGVVEAYRIDGEDDSWTTPRDSDHFFATVEDAVKSLEQYKKELFGKMAYVKNYIRTMNEWVLSIEPDDEIQFTEEDYLPYLNQRKVTSGDNGFWHRSYSRKSEVVDYLKEALHTAYVNINGESFRMKDVDHVRWGRKNAEIQLSDGRKIMTDGPVEFEVVEILFGENRSRKLTLI